MTNAFDKGLAATCWSFFLQKHGKDRLKQAVKKLYGDTLPYTVEMIEAADKMIVKEDKETMDRYSHLK